MGSRAGTGLFWLPLGALPGSSRFDRPFGVEIPRPAQAGGICGKPEARLRCLPDPVQTPSRVGLMGTPLSPHSGFRPGGVPCLLTVPSGGSGNWVAAPVGGFPQQLRVQRTKVELEVGQDPFSFWASPPCLCCLILA